MAKWSYYDLETGLFTGKILSCRKQTDAELNTPKGCGILKGEFDFKSQMVDINTGEVIDRNPPYEEPIFDQVMEKIIMLEKRQVRPLRELTIDPNNLEAKKRLEAIDAEIEVQRQRLKS